MKLYVNKQDILRDLKYLQGTARDGNYADIAGFFVGEDGVLCLAGAVQTTVFGGITAIFNTGVEAESWGFFYVSISQLTGILNAAPDEIIRIAFNKRVAISTDSGFKAQLQPYQGVEPLPMDKALATVSALREAPRMCFPKATFQQLVRASGAMPGIGPQDQHYIYIDTDEDGLYGRIQPSELGTIERLPLGDDYDADIQGFVLSTDLVAGLLSLLGDTVTIHTSPRPQGEVLFRDPDWDTWWSMLAQISIPETMTLEA